MLERGRTWINLTLLPNTFPTIHTRACARTHTNTGVKSMLDGLASVVMEMVAGEHTGTIQLGFSRLLKKRKKEIFSIFLLNSVCVLLSVSLSQLSSARSLAF